MNRPLSILLFLLVSSASASLAGDRAMTCTADAIRDSDCSDGNLGVDGWALVFFFETKAEADAHLLAWSKHGGWTPNVRAVCDDALIASLECTQDELGHVVEIANPISERRAGWEAMRDGMVEITTRDEHEAEVEVLREEQRQRPPREVDG